ncbi:Holliday junction resolvase RecU [Priestia taiwanensis]|uniref:Holliday junction resolvase RecU n=1 Tax=Priestia taiwanensis TaxID=1347902 RepID=A0A917AL68_9BACI|nr:Holliday junction resolvase RecU [Priestia taiwanensis]MBM7361740.1 recombination protein U [Priestia taiwanensis]GGE56594.1 Holliday junction resolvase RecU [Priestia taiwanensis]
MTIRYPNGKVYVSPKETTNTPKAPKKQTTYSNRGMTLEEYLNETNEYYRSKGVACVHKKPTPVQIVHVEYPRRSAAVIKEAYFKQASTTDYNGVYKGKYIDFEAKETRNKTSFPLQNFHVHQIEHMKEIIHHDGIAFVIIKFTTLDEVYLLEAVHLLHFWKRYEHGGRKSITKAELEEVGHPIKLGYQPRIPYLNILDTLYFS